jgi:hypothetical protein
MINCLDKLTKVCDAGNVFRAYSTSLRFGQMRDRPCSPRTSGPRVTRASWWSSLRDHRSFGRVGGRTGHQGRTDESHLAWRDCHGKYPPGPCDVDPQGAWPYLMHFRCKAIAVVLHGAVLCASPAAAPSRTDRAPVARTADRPPAPLPRPVQFHRVEPHLNAVAIGASREVAISRKQRQLAVPPAAFIKGFDLLAPSVGWPSLISPRCSTCRCTILPPAQCLLSTIFQ